MDLVRRFWGAACALLILLLAAAPAAARAPEVLSSSNRDAYRAAFAAAAAGDFAAYDAAAGRITDPILMGPLTFEKLFHRNYVSTYEELVAWLEQYGDEPRAGRVYRLALRKQPEGAPPPPRPERLGPDGEPLEGPRAAREALNADDFTRAYQLAVERGEQWVAGLAAYRMGSAGTALYHFRRVADDPTEDIWVRAGGAFWGARTALATGRPEEANALLETAARWPNTFYGQLALARLGREPEIIGLGPRAYDSLRPPPVARRAPPNVDLDAFVRGEPRARYAIALMEVGRRVEAANMIRRGLRTATDERDINRWIALAIDLGPLVTTPESTFIDAADYPMPDLQPQGGFTVDRALVYALARKESRFDPSTVSSAGAYGLMQVMPTTAAEIDRDPGLAREPRRLLEPALNLRLGQTYLNRMLAWPEFERDLLRSVASYNAGPAPMLQTLRRLPPDADALLLIETLPIPQARQYVEEVAAAYWIYQRLLGQRPDSLALIAEGARTAVVPAPPPPPAELPAQPVEIAAITP
ncbi:lytic transglycosylase domain-containing protein [Brevundimonas sp. 2R-24]|uniref:Lytic transglycosylase domain-containing protein n=1 Tax=Peiella sedimenti TaxID=3061083 RepID=A0ABT8SLJ3_9CAUL|nr:lytic transglycosylase domain-containing protein [Caulobacteraceae bacterium XZ-24]